MLFNAIQHYDGIRYIETGADRRSEIVQESLNNIVKHARAGEVRISVEIQIEQADR
jgi:hypothetical protein